MPALPQILKNGILAFICPLLFIANSQAQANIQPPDELIKVNTLKMLRSINHHRADINKSPDKLSSLIEEIILPQLDFITASKMVMGKYWRRAEKEQKIKFIREFRILLLRFYSSALSEYLTGRNENLKEDLITYFPIELREGEKTITVRGEVHQDTGPAVPIYYRMHLTGKGWKIYDVSVEGISMITTYKNNFATQFNTEGIDSLITSLQEKNKQILANNKNDKKAP